jgi:hypothetical protein
MQSITTITTPPNSYVHAFHRLFIPTCRWISNNLKGGLGPSKSFSPSHFLYISQARAWISTAIVVVFFVFNDFRWEVTVRFVDIRCIVDLHCLHFLFIILKTMFEYNMFFFYCTFDQMIVILDQAAN